jgi:hypothetical protein
MDIAQPLLTYILGFVALEVPRGRHRPPDQRRVRPPHVGLLRRPAPRRVPPHCRAGRPAGPQLHRRPVPVRHPDLPGRPQTPCNRNASTRPDPAQPQTAAASAFGIEPVDAAVTHAEWRCGRHLIAATGGAGRRSAKIAAAPINQSREAHHPARPHHSPKGPGPKAGRLSRRGGRLP